MTKKIFKPFWSYDIEKTENWLSFMAAEGFHVSKMNTTTRHFFFEEGPPKEANYRIIYDTTQTDSFPKALQNDDWRQVFIYRNWQVVCNDKPIDDIQNFPIPDGIMKRNKVMMYIFGGIFIYMLFSVSLFMFLSINVFIGGGNVTFIGSPMWIVTIFITIVMWTLIPYSAIKLYKSNQRLSLRVPSDVDSIYLGDVKERQMKREGKMVSKWRLGWIYSPDKLEKWLEEMEAQGYQLIRINNLGNKFHFVKGAPRKVKYCADYQNSLSQGYFDMHKEAGWDLMYSGTAFLSKWSIWSKAYENDDEIPQLYSEPEHMLKHARRVAMTHSLLFGPLMIMYGYVIYINLTLVQENRVGIQMWILLIIFGIAMIEFSTFVVKSVLYYRRIKKGLVA